MHIGKKRKHRVSQVGKFYIKKDYLVFKERKLTNFLLQVQVRLPSMVRWDVRTDRYLIVEAWLILINPSG